MRWLRIRSLAVVLAMLSCSCPLFSLDPTRDLTQYVHRIWQTETGLPQVTISVLLQAQDGYLWLGTQKGVIRFDGVRFTAIPALVKASLGEVWARRMVDDSQGRIWILSNDSALIRVAGDDVKIYGPAEGIAGDVTCLTRGTNGDVWACTPDGLLRFSGNQSQKYPLNLQAFNPNIGAACQSADGAVWLGGPVSLGRWKDGAFTTQTLRSAPGLPIRSLACAPDGLWIGTDLGLVRWNQGHDTLFGTRNGLPDSMVISLTPGAGGILWIGTRNGFSRLHNGEFNNYGYSDGLSQSTVYSIQEDREGSLWVATKFGLNQFRDSRTMPFTTRDGLPSNNSGPVLEDRAGRLWVGTLDAGLSYFDGRRFQILDARRGLSSNRVAALAEDRSGDLWAATDHGVDRIHGGKVAQVYGTQQGLPSDNVASLFIDKTGRIWAGTQEGPAVLEEGRFQPQLGSNSVLRAPIAAMGETPMGEMILAVERDGVYMLSGGTVRSLEYKGTPLRDVISIYTDPGGLVWLGGFGTGLYVWRGGQMNWFTMRDGLPDGEIFGLALDENDRLWIACSRGFFWVSRADLLRFADDKINKFAVSIYSRVGSLQSVECKPGVQPAVSLGKDGRAWFSTTRGLLSYAPAHQFQRTPPPPVTIEDVTMDGVSVEPRLLESRAFEKIAPGRRNLAFRYTALTFLFPENMRFRYILEGYDKDWTDAGNRREAFYTNLPPGKFRFLVMACPADGNCNTTGAAVSFQLMPYFYQRAWFLPSCLMAAMLLVWLAYRQHTRRIRERFGIILGERSRIARELHDTLIQGFSGVTMQLQALADRMHEPLQRMELEEILKEAGACLRETRQSVAGLRGRASGSGNLASALNDVARELTQEKNVRLKLSLDSRTPDLPSEVKYNLLRIAQEAVSNALKHAGARTISVKLESHKMDAGSQEVCLSIQDDGRGFSRESNGAEGHYGLIGMKERATHVGAAFELLSGLGRGTKISVRLPIHPQNTTITVTKDLPESSIFQEKEGTAK